MYDTVVVGAGSAGCVVAGRLAEGGDRSVLLLEAGPELAHEWTDVVASAGRTFPYRQGRGVGGSSAVNGAVALRPDAGDFDSWPRGWQWADVLPEFIAVERDLDYGDQPWHGDSGPLPIVRYREEEWGAVQRAFADASVTMGFTSAPDLNQPGARGVGPVPMNRVGAERVSAARTFLHEHVAVRSNAPVTRLVLSGTTATAVELAGGEVIPAAEVVVCAGVLETPRLLWRSGVRNPAIGQHLTDHCFVVCSTPVATALVPPGGPTSQVMLRTTDPASDAVDLHLVPYGERVDETTAVFGVRVALQAPAGAGGVLPEAGEGGRAGITWPFLDEVANVARLREGWRLAARLLAETGLSEDPAGLARMLSLRDGELDRLVVETHLPFFHGAGTCAMGSVVDAECRLVGYEGVRVVDASIIPVVPRSNVHLTVLAIAERAAAVASCTAWHTRR